MSRTQILVGELVEEEVVLSVEDLCEACGVERARIVELISHGVLEMHSDHAGQLGGDALRRARLALRLQRDLDLNVAGAALVIDLLRRIEVLEARLRQETQADVGRGKS